MEIRKMTGTANTTYCPGRKILYLAVHYTAGVSSKAGSARGCAAWFANLDAGGSADYIVDEEELVQYNPDPLNRYCHAVGGSRFRTAGGRLYGVAKNSNCVSLEICSTNSKGKITVPNDPAYSFTDKVLEKAREAVQMLMQMYGIDVEHVIRHYDVNGKCCPGVTGWNKDSGDESKWEAFHAVIGGKPIRYYRVGNAWNESGCDGQVGAFISLENAIDAADRNGGVTVYDWDDRVMYVAQVKSSKGAGMTQATDFVGLTEKERALKALELIRQVDDSGILPSVTAAQWVLESGYCTTDLARNACNCFGMKRELSGNSWKSVWDGVSCYGKVTEEQDRAGNTYRVWAEFRKYPCIEDSIRDHSLYLLGAKNGSKKRYEGLTKAQDYREAIGIIKAGGYATDVRYVDKICDIIRRYGLDRYDGERIVLMEKVKGSEGIAVESGKEPVAVDSPVVAVGTQKVLGEAAGQKLYVVQAGAFDVKRNARKRLREVRKLGGSFKKAFMVKSGGHYLVQTGVFEDEQNALRMAKVLEKAGICTYIREK